MKIQAKKDGKGNIIISEDSFEMILSCLDNQKYINESQQNGDSLSNNNYLKTQKKMQETIDAYNKSCRDILHQKYTFNTSHEGFYLYKKYEKQEEIIPWLGEDVDLVYSLFENTKREYKKPTDLRTPTEQERENIKEGDTLLGIDKNGWMVFEPKKEEPWLIERPLRFDLAYLSISEDGYNNRPWKEEEIEKITKLFNETF